MSRPDRRPRPGPAEETAALETRLQELVGDQLHLAVVRRPDGPERSPRSDDFRLGRAALGRVLARIGDPTDPLRVRFPHRSLSLSHSEGTAVAVGIPGTGTHGVGVDLELARDVDVRAARFFLGPGEAGRLGVPPPADPARVQQLWTVKEAVFKADLDNAGRLLRDYEICELDLAAVAPAGVTELVEGVARRGRARFRFRCLRLPDLLLALALPEAAPG